MSIIDQCHLQKLYLIDFDHVVKTISWSVLHTLRHLTIGACYYKDFQLILRHLSHLQTLVFKGCDMDDTIETILESFDVNYPQLKIINNRKMFVIS